MTQPISGKTQTIGLIGSPISHSLSPAMQNAAFAELGLDYAYLAFDVGLEQAEQAVAAIRTLGLRGCNVTSPLKSVVCSYLDALSPAAELAGAVNVIVNDRGYLTGHITDGEGYVLSLREEGVSLTDKKVVIVGAGGAATAVAIQMAMEGARELVLFNRRDDFFSKAQALTKTLSTRFGCRAALFDVDDLRCLRTELAHADLLVNGTTVGMAATQEQSVIPDVSYFHEGLTVSDLIYSPAETRLLSMAKSQGLKTVSGLGMQLYQAVPAFALWTGHALPVDKVRPIIFANA